MVRQVSFAGVVVAVLGGLSPSTGLASFPGQDGRIAFESNGIHTVLPDGTAEQVLTSDPADANPSWSPDGTRIVFTRRAEAPNRAALWIMNSDGTGQIPVTGSGARGNIDTTPDVSASFAPGGNRIVYADGSSIKTIRVDGTGRRPLLRVAERGRSADVPLGPVLDPVYSPDRKRIAFSNGTAGSSWRPDYGIWKMRADGSRPRRVSDPERPESDRYPDFSPDGRRIAFQRKFRGEVFTVGVGGRRERPVPIQLQYSCEPAFSPTGNRLAITGGNFIRTAQGPGCMSMFTIPAAGGPPDQIPGGASPSWQPIP